MMVIFILLTLASVAAWVYTRGIGWALPTAIFGWFIVNHYLHVWSWASFLFWMLVLVALVVLVFAGHLFGRLAMAALVAVVAMAVVFGLVGIANAAKADATSRSSSTSAAAKAGDPVVLKVGDDEVLPTAARCTNGDTFSYNSLKPVGHGRLWSDSVSTPVVAKDKEAQLTEVLSEVCTNPTLGDAYAQALADTKVGGFSVAGANPWLGEFLSKSNGTDQLRGWLVYKLDSDGKIITEAKGSKVIYVTAEYQKYAEKINTLLLAFDNQGAKEGYTSTINWTLGSLTAGNLPRVHKVTDPKMQVNKPFLALTFTTKAGEECPTVFGIDTLDKRPEFVSCEKAKVIAPSTPTVPKTCQQLGNCPKPPPTSPTKPPTTPPTTPPTVPPTKPPTTPPTTPPTVPPTKPPTTPPTTPPTVPPTKPPTTPPTCLEKECKPAPVPPPSRTPAASPASTQEISPPAPPASPATTATPVIPGPGATSAPKSTDSRPVVEPSGMATGDVDPDE